eukprot:2452564-Lingulodinium_polyedra.AAC.1
MAGRSAGSEAPPTNAGLRVSRPQPPGIRFAPAASCSASARFCRVRGSSATMQSSNASTAL